MLGTVRDEISDRILTLTACDASEPAREGQIHRLEGSRNKQTNDESCN